MAKLLSSIPLNNLTDYIISIDDYTFPENTLVADADQIVQCVLKGYTEDQQETIHLVFGVEEGINATVTLKAPGISSEPYTKTTKNFVTPILTDTAGIFFGGHPKPKPPRAIEE